MSELFFDESVILLDVEGNSNEEVLNIVAQNLVDKGLVKESFVPAIIAVGRKNSNRFANSRSFCCHSPYRCRAYHPENNQCSCIKKAS